MRYFCFNQIKISSNRIFPVDILIVNSYAASCEAINKTPSSLSNVAIAKNPVRLFPSTKGWFIIKLSPRAEAFSKMVGY